MAKTLEQQIRERLEGVSKEKAKHDSAIAKAEADVKSHGDALKTAKAALKTAKAAAKDNASEHSRLTRTLNALTGVKPGGGSSSGDRARRKVSDAVDSRLKNAFAHLTGDNAPDGNSMQVKALYTAMGGRDSGAGARWGTLRDSVNANGDRYGLKMADDGLTVIADPDFGSDSAQTTIPGADDGNQGDDSGDKGDDTAGA